MTAFDTNVLVYAHDPRDPIKQAKAIELIESTEDCVLLWQVACEYFAVSKKLEPYGLSPQRAYARLQKLRLVWPLITPSWSAFTRAAEIQSRFGVSVWDSLLLGACKECGVRTLYTEDLPAADMNSIHLDIINPFQ